VTVFLNGQIVPEEQAAISVFDRGFLYGDGLFATMRVFNGRVFRWGQHWERLQRGADFLGIKIPFSREALGKSAMELIERNRMPDALLRLTLSRGVGVRGYSAKGAERPVVVMSLHAAQAIDLANRPRWKLATSSVRVPADDLIALHKTCNKLPQIMARMEAEAQGADEALLLNTDGEVAEAASSNLFWCEGGAVCTTPLATGILAGVTRAVVIELCRTLEMPVREKRIKPDELRKADGVFLTMSSLGIVEIASLDGRTLARSANTEKIRQAYEQTLLKECTTR